MTIRRLALFGVAFVVAGCIGFTGDPTVAPSVAPSPRPSPTRSPFDFASFTPFPVATPTSEPCPARANGWDATLDLGTATGVVSIAVDDGVALPLPSDSVEPVDPADIVVEGTVLGGTELTAALTFDGMEQSQTTITAAGARFLPLDGSPASPVIVAIDGTNVVLTLPDKDAIGRLLVQLDWSTRCGTGSGGGGTALMVQNSKIAAGCPTTGDAMLAAVRKIGASYRITIGGLQEPLDVDAWSARWAIGNGVDDYGTFFPNWDKNDLVSVAPGVNVPVREKVGELHLVSVRASIYTRADVDASIDTNGDVDAVTVVRRDVNPNGNVNIPAPLQPGSYVFVVEANWLTSCFELHTTRTVAVKVR